jgi:hypothetical protein
VVEMEKMGELIEVPPNRFCTLSFSRWGIATLSSMTSRKVCCACLLLKR